VTVTLLVEFHMMYNQLKTYPTYRHTTSQYTLKRSRDFLS